MLPTLQLLEKVSKEIKSIPNRKGENLRKVHYGCFLLCHKAGLRVSEAVSFDLTNKTKKGLYRIEKPKGKKERLVYVPKKVIRELRKHNWKPSSTNRFNFYHFLRKIKRELNISKNIELSPHTLRHAFATYQAEAGLSLPILSKMLGHVSVRTTALYWQNIHQKPDNDIGPILAGKNWLERPKPSQSQEPSKSPITENFPQVPKTPNPVFIEQKPLISNKQPIQQYNSLSVPKTLKKTPQISVSEISPKILEKFSLNPVGRKSDQLKISQPLAITVNKEQKPTKKELILLQKIKHLKSQLSQIQTKNSHLSAKLTQTEQEKAKLEVIVIQEKQRANNYHHQLKTIARILKQWQKINYYQQLEQEQTAQIEQPPPFKVKK